MKPSPFASPRLHKVNASMNVVPYIDVMLVLLVIFMVTAPMMTTGVDVDLPKAQAKKLATGTQLPVIVSLKANGELYMSYQNTTDQKVQESELVAILHGLQDNPTYQVDGKPNVNVMINADKANNYGTVMQLMANLQQAGIQKVGLLTASPKSSNTKNSESKAGEKGLKQSTKS